MKIFRILSLSLASAYEQFDYESELGLARWVIWVVGREQPIYDFFRGRGQREGEIMAYSFNGEEDADEMMNALYSLAGKSYLALQLPELNFGIKVWKFRIW